MPGHEGPRREDHLLQLRAGSPHSTSALRITALPAQPPSIAFLILAAALLIRFLRTVGRDMLRMMGGAPDTNQDHAHGEHRGRN